METKQKKVEVEINGKLHRVMPHMLKDVMKFGGSVVRRTLKDAPRELTVIPLPKKIILPKTEPEKPLEVKPLDIKPPEVVKEIKPDYPSEPVQKVEPLVPAPETKKPPVKKVIKKKAKK